MPNLGKEWIRTRIDDGVSGQPYTLQCDVSVDRKGDFRFVIPDDYVVTAQQMVKERKEFKVFQLKKNWVVSGREMEKTKTFLGEIVKAHMQCEIIREKVIVYKTSSDLAYWRTAKGEIFPTADFDKQGYEQGTGKFCGDNHATQHTETFRVGIAAKVYEKITARRRTGDHVTYKLTYGDGDHWSKDTWLQKLNQFVGVHFGGWREEQLGGMDQIPYTEEAAKFFYDAMIALCKLSDQIERFFESPETVQKAIESRKGLFLSSGK